MNSILKSLLIVSTLATGSAFASTHITPLQQVDSKEDITRTAVNIYSTGEHIASIAGDHSFGANIDTTQKILVGTALASVVTNLVLDIVTEVKTPSWKQSALTSLGTVDLLTDTIDGLGIITSEVSYSATNLSDKQALLSSFLQKLCYKAGFEEEPDPTTT